MLAKRAASLKPSPTLALAAKAKELLQQGKDVISLSVGEPDWDTFPAIKDAGIKAIQAGQTKYAPANGLPELRKAIAEITSKELLVNYDLNDVTVTAGAKMSVFAALQVLCDVGDEVVIPSPYWVSYPTMAELADAKPVIATSSEKHRFKLTAENLEQVMTAKTKVLILNSPSNPTGEVYSKQELLSLAVVIRKHPKVVVISDDIYNSLVFDLEEKLAPHILHVAPDLKDRVVVINGASKSLSMTGWRLGWALGPKPVVQAMTNYQSQSVSCAAPFTQLATLEGLKKCNDDLTNSVKKLKERCHKTYKILSDVPGIRLASPQGAFYLWPNINDLLGKSLGGKKINTSKDFAEIFLEDYWVATVPGIEFGCEGYLRLSYVIAEEKMNEAIKRLKQFVGDLT